MSIYNGLDKSFVQLENANGKNLSNNAGLHKPKILAVDDENAILLGLRQELVTAGYAVSTAGDGATALREIQTSQLDLVLLDLMLPDYSGLEIIHRIREGLHNDVPIIVLSARGEERQKVEALDLGANDYLTKPFGMKELLARVRVSLRSRVSVSAWSHAYSSNDEDKGAGETSLPDHAPSHEGLLAARIIGNQHLKIDLARHLVLRDGEEIKLTPKQFDLLTYLAFNPDKLLTHRSLLHNIWGSDHQCQTEYFACLYWPVAPQD